MAIGLVVPFEKESSLVTARMPVRGKRGRVDAGKLCADSHPGKTKPSDSLDMLVGRAGVEPTTNGLKVRCSTN